MVKNESNSDRVSGSIKLRKDTSDTSTVVSSSQSLQHCSNCTFKVPPFVSDFFFFSNHCVCSGGSAECLRWVSSGLLIGVLSYEQICETPWPLAPIKMSLETHLGTPKLVKNLCTEFSGFKFLGLFLDWSCSFITEMCILVPQFLYTDFGVDRVKNQNFYSYYCFKKH